MFPLVDYKALINYCSMAVFSPGIKNYYDLVIQSREELLLIFLSEKAFFTSSSQLPV